MSSAARWFDGGEGAAINWKRVFAILAVVFAFVFVIKDPDGAARFVHSVWHGVVHIADQISEFLRQAAQ